jgi:hypothetical protein
MESASTRLRPKAAALLYAGHRGNPPGLRLVSLDMSVADKLETARFVPT